MTERVIWSIDPRSLPEWAPYERQMERVACFRALYKASASTFARDEYLRELAVLSDTWTALRRAQNAKHMEVNNA